MSHKTTSPESGFTLVELLVAITVSGLIISALTSGFIVALKGTAGAHERFMASNAAQTFATYFTSDVQSADPTSIRTDDVETGCASSSADTTSSNVVRMQWTENTSAPTSLKFFASYRVQQSGTEWQLARYFCTGRSADDGVTNGSNILTSAKAAFTAADTGMGVVGANIPTGTKILAYNSPSSVTMDHAATATGTAIAITIVPDPVPHIVAHDLDAPGERFSDGATTGTTTLTSATAAFTASDVGRRLTGKNIPVGTTIASYTNSTTVVMSSPATGSGSLGTFTVGRPVRALTDGMTSTGSKTLTSSSAAFGVGDVGRALTGTNIPPGTTIASVTNPTTAVMSAAATSPGTPLPVAVGAPYAVVGPTVLTPLTVSLTLSGVQASSNSSAYSFTVTATMRPPLPPPAVTSISRAGNEATNASSVQWNVSFNRAVSGVNASDFSLDTAGITGASLSSITPTGVSSASYAVTVNTGSGDGTLGLNLVDDDSIYDTAASTKKLGGAGTGNGSFTGDAYTVDKTAPTVVVAQKVDPDDSTNNQADPATSLPIVFTISFSEPVEDFLATDVTLTGTAPVGTATKILTGSRSEFELAVSGLTSGGTVIASFAAGRTPDAAGNLNLVSDPTSDHTVTYSPILAATTTSVSSSVNPSVVNQTVSYTATVAVTPPGTGTPTGNVEFFDGGGAITACGGTTGQALSGTSATCVVTYTTTGTHTITAQYLGGTGYTASPMSGSITQTVNPVVPVVTITDTAGSGHREIYGGTTTANSGTLTVRVFLGSSATGTPVKTYTTTTFNGSSPYSWSIAPAANNELTTGLTYTAQAIHVDSAGNVSSQQTVTFTAH